jgi:hypothetical protein
MTDINKAIELLADLCSAFENAEDHFNPIQNPQCRSDHDLIAWYAEWQRYRNAAQANVDYAKAWKHDHQDEKPQRNVTSITETSEGD